MNVPSDSLTGGYYNDYSYCYEIYSFHRASTSLVSGTSWICSLFGHESEYNSYHLDLASTFCLQIDLISFCVVLKLFDLLSIGWTSLLSFSSANEDAPIACYTSSIDYGKAGCIASYFERLMLLADQVRQRTTAACSNQSHLQNSHSAASACCLSNRASLSSSFGYLCEGPGRSAAVVHGQ